MSPKSLHFLAPADIKTRNKEFRDYLKEIAGILDILSINENECNWLAKAIGCGDFVARKEVITQDNVRSSSQNNCKQNWNQKCRFAYKDWLGMV